MAYSIDYKSSVSRDLKKFNKPEANRILDKLEDKFKQDPNAGEPLKGKFAGLFRLRIGSCRVIYSKTRKGVLVSRIAHRKEAYQ